MPNTWMDWATIIGPILAVIGLWLAWRGLKTRKPRVVQDMTNSSGSKQTATRDDIQQKMDNVTDGEQKG